jgi:transcriptional regulator with XRE-family HTH domain
LERAVREVRTIVTEWHKISLKERQRFLGGKGAPSTLAKRVRSVNGLHLPEAGFRTDVFHFRDTDAPQTEEGGFIASEGTGAHRFGERLLKARIARGMSLSQLAVEVGVTPAAVWKWEHGKAFPQGARLSRLVEVLETSISFLATGVDASENASRGYAEQDNLKLADVISLARGMVAEAASLPVSAVSISLNPPPGAAVLPKGEV